MSNETVDFCYLAEEVKLCELAGVKVRDYYDDLDLMVETQNTSIKIISDCLEIPPQDYLLCYGHVKASEVMGCKVYYPENGEPSVSKGVLNSIDQVTSFDVPPPEDNPVVQRLLQKAARFFELTGIKDTVTFEGPFTTAGFLRGQTQFLLDTVDSPALCDELISRVTDAAIEWKEYHDSEMGISNPETIALIDDSIANVNPDTFDRIVVPHLVRWYETFPAPKRHFHCCGNIDNFLEAFRKLDLASYDFMGEMVDLARAKEVLEGTYISRLLDFRLVRDLSESGVTEYVTRELEIGSKGGNFGIVLEGQLGIPLSRARLVRDLIAEWNGGTVNTFDTLRDYNR